MAGPGRSGYSAAAVLIAAILCMGLAAAAESDDWIGRLGVKGESAAQDSGVIGMTADEADSYAGQQEADAGGDAEVPDTFVRGRRRFVMQEMKFNSDWDCDPTAVPAMVDQFKVRTGMDAQALLPHKPLTFDSPEMLDWPFVYLSAHYAFTLSEAEEKGLRQFIERGGFVYADDCLYGQTFGPAFQGLVTKLFPECEFKAIDLGTPGQKMLYHQKYSFKNVHESGVPMEFLNANPFLCLMFRDRMALVYSPQDIGCAWEISSPPTPSNPLGAGMHSSDMNPQGREAGYRLGVNIILFSMTH